MNKYKAKKTVFNGIEFDSGKEAKRYSELQLLEKAGKITDLVMQKRFELIPAQYEQFERYSKKGNRLQNGTRCIERAVYYVADFVYTDERGDLVVEDTKGVRTKDYVIKRKLMLYKHGIKISEV